MLSWILALLLALIVWLLATAYFWLIKRKQKETQLGLTALAGMHWREFSMIVRRAMHEQRGLQDVADEAADRGEPRSDFLMHDGPQRWLLSCKHGRAYRIGTAAVNELGAAARLAGARGGILITEGKVERGAGVRLIRDNVVIHEGTLKTLKRFKDEVSEVPGGQECGMAFQNYEDMRVGDVIECFRVEMVTRTL